MMGIDIEHPDSHEDEFVVDSDFRAERALKKIAEIDQEYLRYSNVCQKQIDFYKLKKEEAQQKRDEAKSYLLFLLEQYFGTIEPRKTKTKASYKLPSGTLVKKFERQELNHDPDLLLKMLEGTKFVENKPSLKWGEFKKTLKIVGDKVVNEDGEVIDGVTIETKPGKFDVEV